MSPSRRAQIAMSEPEVERFLASERVVTCATIGPAGWPHLMPLWFVIHEPRPQLWAWTYAASQKARNLERDPRATLQVQAGDTYDQLRGVMLECEVLMHHDPTVVAELGTEIFLRYAPNAPDGLSGRLDPGVVAMVQEQASKRVALQFQERRRASWDHRKLAGAY